jgi:hypothetical protein
MVRRLLAIVGLLLYLAVDASATPTLAFVPVGDRALIYANNPEQIMLDGNA